MRNTVDAANRDNDGYMILADYDVNDKLGVAVRFSKTSKVQMLITKSSQSLLTMLSLTALVLSLNIVMLTTTMLNPKSTPLSLPTLSKFYT